MALTLPGDSFRHEVHVHELCLAWGSNRLNLFSQASAHDAKLVLTVMQSIGHFLKLKMSILSSKKICLKSQFSAY